MPATPLTRISISASRCPGTARILPMSPYIARPPAEEARPGAESTAVPAIAAATNVRLLMRMSGVQLLPARRTGGPSLLSTQPCRNRAVVPRVHPRTLGGRGLARRVPECPQDSVHPGLPPGAVGAIPVQHFFIHAPCACADSFGAN